MADTYELTFSWPHLEPTNVFVTGTFDNWTCSLKLERKSFGFEGTVRVPWASKIIYKFVVDGYWTTKEDLPTEYDEHGNVNNVIFTPDKPAVPEPPVEDKFEDVVVPPPAAPIEVEEPSAPTPVDPTPAPKPEPESKEEVVPPVAEPVEDKVVAVPTEALGNGSTDAPKEEPVESPGSETIDTPAPVPEPEPIIEPKPKYTETPTPAPAPEPEPVLTPEPIPVPAPVDSTPVEPTPVSAPVEPTPVSAPVEPTPVSAPVESTLVPTPVDPTPVPAPEELTPVPAPIESAPEPAPAPPSKDEPVKPEEPPATPRPSTPAPVNGHNGDSSTIDTTPPSTPKKSAPQPFPSTGIEDSPGRGSTRSRTGSERKKRVSIIDKIKAVFHHKDQSPERPEKKKRHSLFHSHSGSQES